VSRNQRGEARQQAECPANVKGWQVDRSALPHLCHQDRADEVTADHEEYIDPYSADDEVGDEVRCQNKRDSDGPQSIYRRHIPQAP
jgi:hypothetical protein